MQNLTLGKVGNIPQAPERTGEVCKAPEHLGLHSWALSLALLYLHGPRRRKRAALTLCQLHEAQDDDESQRQQLGCSKGILHTGGSFDTVAVHSCEQH